MPICVCCLKQLPVAFYNRVITRRTHSPDADENGDEHYLKTTKSCLNCRESLKKRARLHVARHRDQ